MSQNTVNTSHFIRRLISFLQDGYHLNIGDYQFAFVERNHGLESSEGYQVALETGVFLRMNCFRNGQHVGYTWAFLCKSDDLDQALPFYFDLNSEEDKIKLLDDIALTRTNTKPTLPLTPDELEVIAA